MIDLALSHPDQAEERWNHLLDTNGERIRILEDGTWVDYYTGRKILKIDNTYLYVAN